GKARLWSVATRDLERPRSPALLTAKELDRLWEDLAAADHARADAAFRGLAAAGDRAVPFLREQLRRVAVPKVDAERIAGLVRDLGGRVYSGGRKACGELGKSGELAGPPLRKFVAGKPSTEAERRANQLLDRLKEPGLTPDATRCLEALELLEWLGSDAARRT